MPKNNRFGPLGVQANKKNKINMTVDEYETIRLIDFEGFTQEECANQMGVARSTVQGIYAEARKKIAKSIVDGEMLIIEGGEYKLCEESEGFCGRGCHKRRRNGGGV
jgi:predicted DNA-binding protein (UPF0251 family)